MQALWDGLRGIGLEPFVEDPAFRLATVNTIKVQLRPPNLDLDPEYPCVRWPQNIDQ